MSSSTEIVPPAAKVSSIVKEKNFLFILDTQSTHITIFEVGF